LGGCTGLGPNNPKQFASGKRALRRRNGSLLPGDADWTAVRSQGFARSNIQKKTYFVPSLGRKVTLNLSARGIKVIDVRGIDSVIAELVARGEKI
jgi:hypothetical protein